MGIKKISIRVSTGVGLIVTFIFGMLIGPLLSEAQQKRRVPRIGYLKVGSELNLRDKAFQQTLSDLGYTEGGNIIIQYQLAMRNVENLPKLAKQLVQDKVDIIVALDPSAARAAVKEQKIPLVVRWDQLETRLDQAKNANVSGFDDISNTPDLFTKRLELLKEVLTAKTRAPLSHVGVFRNPAAPGGRRFDQMKNLAKNRLNLELEPLEVKAEGPSRIEPIEPELKDFKTKNPASGLITIRNNLVTEHIKDILNLAIKYKTAAIYDDREIVEAGGLMSYGPDLAYLYRQAAFYVDKILKGAKPATIPMSPVIRFELSINLDTAQRIGLDIAPDILILADKVNLPKTFTSGGK
jgi:ABC-type uncharacterized transport system substrate-binding protein